MDLLELAWDLVEKGSGWAGLGGGIVATRVLSRIQSGLKDAKQAKERADAAHTTIAALQADFVKLRNDLETLRSNHPSLMDERERGALNQRLNSLENDFDSFTRENSKSWEAILRAVGRIEGTIQFIRGLNPDR